MVAEDEAGVHFCVQGRDVALLESSNGPLTQVAAELGVQPSALPAWRAAIDGTVMPPRAVAPRTGTVGPRAASLADLASQETGAKARGS